MLAATPNARLEALIERQNQILERKTIDANRRHAELMKKLESVEALLVMVQGNTEK